MEYSIYQSAHYGAFDKIQILTIEGLLSGTESPHYPDLSRRRQLQEGESGRDTERATGVAVTSPKIIKH